MNLETIQDANDSTVGSGMPHFNVSCQICRISKTFLTMQGVNGFRGEHEGHVVIEGRLFEGVLTPKKPEVVAEISNPQAGAVPDVTPESEDVIAEVIALETKSEAKEVADVELREEAPAPHPVVIEPAEMRLRERITPATSLLSAKDLDEPLLLARSSYIGESEEKRFDALRVSRALKEFKWNVEPPYVIGIMVDDNLSVETNIGVISSSMLKRVEELGYKFVATNAPQGSPVAWFKRLAQESPETDIPVGDMERTMQVTKGTRTYDKDKAVWEESFQTLLMTVKNMDGQKLNRITSIIKSERPEPDLQS